MSLIFGVWPRSAVVLDVSKRVSFDKLLLSCLTSTRTDRSHSRIRTF